MLRTTCVARAPDSPEQAVALAFLADGLRPEHVLAVAIDGEGQAWRWTLLDEAPSLADAEVTTFDADERRGRPVPARPRHPVIAAGVVVDTEEQGFVVVTGSDSFIDQDLVDEARQLAADMERMGGAR